jgi:sterol desaturase/sphingolipid hydroxylase (fatty acid hydroxylase superfamily)
LEWAHELQVVTLGTSLLTEERAMSQFIIDNAQWVRLGFFATIFGAMALWEILDERRELRTAKGRRWATNAGIIVADSLILRLIFPMGALGAAYFTGSMGWGLFNAVSVPYAVAVIGAFIALDFVVWLQHVVFHAVPALWKVHMMHHADLDFDVTTGTRFHPIEMVISVGIKAAAILLLGAPVLAVLIFEVILNATSMFNHANIDIPRPADRVLRLILVTPQYAPGPPFGGAEGDEHELRIQSTLVGLPVWHLSLSARGGPPRDADRPQATARPGQKHLLAPADPAVRRSRRRLRHQPPRDRRGFLRNRGGRRWRVRRLEALSDGSESADGSSELYLWPGSRGS